MTKSPGKPLSTLTTLSAQSGQSGLSALLANSNALSDSTLFTYVRKWIDYSSKYGIGYSLTNGSCGVYFNDSSKMLASNEEQFYYIDKVAREDVCKKYSFGDYPV